VGGHILTRKLRTRTHIIEDLSINHVERFAFQCGFSTERITRDYGIDLLIFTYDANGEVENGFINMQLKATDKLVLVKEGTHVSFSVEKAHLETWLDEPYPVILTVYDAQSDCAYWLYIQKYFEELPGFNLQSIGKETTVHIPVTNKLDKAAMTKFAQFKERILSQVRGVIRHA
jgi:hypothetical protein